MIPILFVYWLLGLEDERLCAAQEAYEAEMMKGPPNE